MRSITTLNAIKILNMEVEGLDDKRPFGNSNVASDMFDLLDIDIDACSESELNELTQYVHGLYDDLGEFLRKRWLVTRKRRKVPTSS